MPVEIQPFDSLFFRNGKPFSMGEEVWGGGMFPPPPSVVYGALRTAFFSRNLAQLSQANEAGDVSLKLRIRQVLLSKLSSESGKTEVYFPCPFDVVESKNRAGTQALLSLTKWAGISSHPTQHLLTVKDQNILPVNSLGGGHWISLNQFKAYLLYGDAPAPYPASAFMIPEPKIGIQKSRASGKAADGMLYRVGMTRPQSGVGLYVDWVAEDSGFQLSEAGFLKLGAEGKSASFQQSPLSIDIKAPQIEGNVIKLVFTTPAVFEHGWLPGSIDPKTRKGAWGGEPVEVLTAAFNRAAYQGGFSMKATKNQPFGPKPMRKAVPAGAVYYIRIDGDVQQAVESLHGQCLSDYDADQQGFGLAFVGSIF